MRLFAENSVGILTILWAAISILIGGNALQGEVRVGIAGGQMSDSTAVIRFTLDNPVSLGGVQFDISDDGNPLLADSILSGARLNGFRSRIRELESGAARLIVYPDPGANASQPLLSPDSGEFLRVVYHIGSLPIPDSVHMSIEHLIVADSTGRKTEAAATDAVFYPTGLAEEPGGSPSNHRLLHNYPNPFNAGTAINFYLARQVPVDLRILNIRGQTVRILSTRTVEQGYHTIRWNGVNQQGKRMSSGVYLCRLQAGSMTLFSKMLLLK